MFFIVFIIKGLQGVRKLKDVFVSTSHPLLPNVEPYALLPLGLVSYWRFLLVSREGEFSVFPGSVWCWKEALCCRGLKSTATAGSGRDGSLYSGVSVF